MERDFLGLGSKNSPITVKEETSESSRDSAPNRGMNWSFSNKASATSSQFLSFRPSQVQEDRHNRKPGNYHLPHSGSFMPSSVADVYDSNRSTPYSSVQGVAMFSNSNQQDEAIAGSMSRPGLQSHYASGGKNFISNSINSQPLVEVPIMAPPISVFPAPGSIVGTTDIRCSSKPSVSPAQLTIFYAGSVCVYDDISPEKAKAIMLLAGNGSSMPQVFSPPQTHQHVVHHTRASVDSSAMPQVFSPPQTHQQVVHHARASVDSSAMPQVFPLPQTHQQVVHHARASVDSSAMPQVFPPPQTHHQVVHHARASVDSSAMPPSFMPTVSYLSPEAGSSTNGFGAAKATRGFTSTYHNNQTNASNINCSVAVSCSTNVPQTVALPLARKASLARFLEKRKERVTSVSPYFLDKKSSTDCRTPMSDCISSSLSSAT